MKLRFPLLSLSKVAIATLSVVSGALLSAPAKAATWSGLDLRSGKKTDLTVKSDQWTAVVFLSPTCPCSNSHVSALEELAKANPSIQFVGIHSNSSDTTVASTYFKAKKLSFPVLQDDGGHWASQYKALRTPHAYLISPDGKTVFQGGVTDSSDCSRSTRNYLREAIADTTNQRPVKTPLARALGCPIEPD